MPGTVLSSLHGPFLEYTENFYEERTIIIILVFQMRKLRYGIPYLRCQMQDVEQETAYLKGQVVFSTLQSIWSLLNLLNSALIALKQS